MATSADGEVLALGSYLGSLELWSAETGEKLIDFGAGGVHASRCRPMEKHWRRGVRSGT